MAGVIAAATAITGLVLVGPARAAESDPPASREAADSRVTAPADHDGRPAG
ncbi:hypothetical protein [Streptomyces durbertensis]|uniref:hypothetical protein n=1 Tax=Streptomyces durbertensis TaxID=2448886 RepID=UPI001E5254E0|nr:hypothetical protein [Streptomyces durbertensis]